MECKEIIHLFSGGDYGIFCGAIVDRIVYGSSVLRIIILFKLILPLIVLSFLRMDKAILKRMKAGWDENYLSKLLEANAF